MISWPVLLSAAADLAIVSFAATALWVRFSYSSVFSNAAIRHGSSLVVIGCGLLAAPFLADLLTADPQLLNGKTGALPVGRIAPLLGTATLMCGVMLSRRGFRALLENLGRTHAKLHESETRWRLLANAPFEAIVIHDEGTIVDANEASARMFGLDPAEGVEKNILELVAPGSREFVKDKIQNPCDEPYECEAKHTDGTVLPVRVRTRDYPIDGRALRVTAIRDLSEEKRQRETLNRTEQQLQQAQKMEAVGRLAAGVAHDFNNLLMVITGYTAILEEETTESADSRAFIREIAAAAKSASALTRQLLAFSRKQVLRPKVLDLNEVATGQAKMLRRLIGEDIDLVFVPGGNLGPVEADPGQIEQILMNLAVNARDAMPDGGKLTLSTKNVRFDESYVSEHAGSKVGEYAMLAVSDTGIGIPKEARPSVFEPFFTTKGEGKGTGLGLSTVYGIVKQSGGYIELYSEVGEGTTFKIYLPRVANEAQEHSSGDEKDGSMRGSETVLLVEDDAALRTLVRRILERQGYTVLEACGGKEAQLLCERFSGPLHLMLTDVVMPEMNGRHVWEQIVALRPDVRVVYMSGYTDDAIVQHGVLEPDVAFIEKPFSPETLSRKVREVLDC